MDEKPILTEPMSLTEIERFLGQGPKGARRFAEASGGVRCGSQWQIPVARMPWSYHHSRGAEIGRFLPIQADSANSKTDEDKRRQPNTMAGARPLLSERDAAIHLHLTLRDLNSLPETGWLPYLSIGGEIRFDPADIRDFVRAMKTAKPTSMERTCRL